MDPQGEGHRSSAHPRVVAAVTKGARGGARTRTPLRAMDFESIEYANFSTRAGAEKGSGDAVARGSDAGWAEGGGPSLSARGGAGPPGRPGSGPRRPGPPAPGGPAWRRCPGGGRGGGSPTVSGRPG